MSLKLSDNARDLQGAGYITSIMDSANSRLVRVKLTKKGAGAVSATTADILAVTSVIRAHLGEEMLEDLIARLNYVEQRLCQL